MNQVRRYQSVSLWIAVFSINFIFQLYRGFDPDLIYFGIALLLVILESIGLLDWVPEFKGLRKVTIYILPVFSVVTIFLKRESNLGKYLFYALFILMFVALWRRNSGDQKNLNKREINLARSISFILIFICFWEILMFTLARVFSNDWLYPTLSELIVPHLDGFIGRSIFLTLWCALGIFIIRDWDET